MTQNQKTNENVICPTCCTGRLRPQLITERFPYEGDGEKTTVVVENVPVRVCNKCGEKVSGPAAADIRHKAICRALGLLTSAEIRSIRERLGLTQEQFSKLTRIGEATICRWERGRLLQSPAMDRYLRLIASSEANVRLLREWNQDGVPGVPPILEVEPERPVTDLGFGQNKGYRPMNFTLNELLTFAARNEAEHWATLCHRAPFRYHVTQSGIEYVPRSKKPRPVPRNELASFCAEFQESGSFAPSDYPHRWHKSYTLPLIRKFLQSRGQIA